MFYAQYTSFDTGLIYMRARAYDPTTAQFLTADPLTNITRAPYYYAGDNPLNKADPTGLMELSPCESRSEYEEKLKRIKRAYEEKEATEKEIRRETENEPPNESEGERINSHIQQGCDLSGPAVLVGLSKVPGVAQAAGAFCVGFTGARLLTGQNVGG